ncbi:MAG: type IV pilin protein [Gallionellaceae bacterium]
MRLPKGFTLIELLTVLAIIGILTVIVVPSYQNYVYRGKVPDAASNLAAKRVQMEQWYQDNRTYVGAPACNTDTSSSQYFTFSCPVAPDALTYTIQAAGTGSMAGFNYTIDQNNNKTSSIVSPAPSGWIGSNSSCWIIKQGGGC